MHSIKLLHFADSKVQFIDGDRGVNYPKKHELSTSGDCVFLNTGNVTTSGFKFEFVDVDFITAEKDLQLRKGRALHGDIIMTTRGTVGNVAFFDEKIPYDKIRINSGMVIIRSNTNEYLPYFLYIYFRSALFKEQCLLHGSGSAQPQLPISALKNIFIPVIGLREQQRIINILKVIDDKIELNNRINAELEAMAKLIYDYWFVQFDFPDANGKPYKSSGGKMAYNQELKREIPDGWEVKPISEKLSIGSGYAFSSENYQKFGRYKLITIKNVQNAGLDTTNTDFIDELPDNIKPYCILNKQDTLISLTGNVGRLCIVNENNLLLNQRVGKFLCPPKWNWYFYCLYSRPEMRNWMESFSTGCAQKNLSPIDAVSKIHYLPPIHILEKFIDAVDSNFKLLTEKSVESKALADLRDWLLPMLMNGQVTVKDAEQELAKQPL